MKLLGRAMDKEFWKEVRESDKYKSQVARVAKFWDEIKDKPILAHKFSDFRLFVDTGNRAVYEKGYFERHGSLFALGMLVLVYPENEEYLDRLMDEIYAICDEYTWSLPAHQPTPEKNNNCHLDLFACETGYALAEIYTLLGDKLEPLILDRIRVEIDRRITTPYMTKRFGWEHGDNNWATVCMGSVACTMMLMHPELVNDLIPRFNETAECFLSGFKDDGMCFEGCGYWHYGFGFFVMYADMIRTFTNGEVDYFKREKVKTIATFMQKMFLSGGASVSFADGGRSVSYATWLLHYLKKEYPDDIIIYSPKYSANGVGKFCTHYRTFLYYNDEYATNYADDSGSRETYAADSQWLVKRTPNYGFAAKGGCNYESHNHNDVGTFIFAKNGRQMVVDMGAGKYTRQYFENETRYTFIECSSKGHNLPSIGEHYQGYGRQFKANDVKYENGVFSMDITSAYEPIEGLNSIKRSFSFTDEAVTLNDKIDYNGNEKIIERLIALVKPELCDGYVKIDEACAYFDKDKYDVEIVTEIRKENVGECYLVTFTLKDGVKEFTVEIR